MYKRIALDLKEFAIFGKNKHRSKFQYYIANAMRDVY